MNKIDWVPYKPLPGKEEQAYWEACSEIQRLQFEKMHLKLIVSRIYDYLLENELIEYDDKGRRKHGEVSGSDLPMECIWGIVDIMKGLIENG